MPKKKTSSALNGEGGDSLSGGLKGKPFEFANKSIPDGLAKDTHALALELIREAGLDPKLTREALAARWIALQALSLVTLEEILVHGKNENARMSAVALVNSRGELAMPVVNEVRVGRTAPPMDNSMLEKMEGALRAEGALIDVVAERRADKAVEA